MDTLLPTTLVGSYPQPDWLIDREELMSTGPPRIRMTSVWRPDPAVLQAAKDDAVRIVVAEQEQAGLDIISDGEVRRESYFNQFANALNGIDLDNPGQVLSRLGRPTFVPRVVGPVGRSEPVLVNDVRFLRSITDKPVKVTLPGPFTMTRLVQDDHYHNETRLIRDYADAVNAELRDLVKAGADIIQLDEPYLQANADEAKRLGIEAINRALDGITCTKALHLCFGYAYVVKDKPSGYSFLPELEDSAVDQISIEAAEPKLDLSALQSLPTKSVILGVLDMGQNTIETTDYIAGRVEQALRHIEKERLILAPDCGMKFLPHETARSKLNALVDGARHARSRLS